MRHWDRLFGGGSGRDVVMLLDASASMNARTAGRSALDRAKAAALAVAARLGKDDRLTLLRVGAQPTEVFGRFSADAETTRERIEAVQSGPARANLFAAFSRVLGQARRDQAPAVYLFSDSQSSSWREVREQGLDRVIPEQTKITVVDVGGDATLANRGVIGDAPRRELAVVGLPVRLRPRVVNHARNEPAELTVGVFLDDKEVARIPLPVQPGESASKEIIYTPTEPGVIRGRFEIAADRFPDDDSFLFVLHVVPQLKVLLVNGYPSADPFENEALYARAALSSTTDGDRDQAGARPPAKALGPSPEFVKSLDVREIAEGQLNPDSLREIGVVILLNCGQLGKEQYLTLREFVRSGGGLLIFPGDKVNADSYSRQFFPVPGQQGETLTAATLGSPQGDRDKQETFLRLTSIDFAHPALSVFDDPEHRYLVTASFYRRFPITLARPRSAAWALARFDNGAPALVENHLGTGVAILAAFPATARWTNLPLKPEFVPLLLRLVSYAAQAPDLVVPSTVPADGAAELSVAGTWAPAIAKVIDPLAQSTAIALERSASRLLGQFDQTSAKGYYRVEARGGRLEPPQAAVAAFAVNTAPEESNFQTVAEDQIREWLPTAQLSFISASSGAEQTYGSLGEEREVWRPLILLVFALIAAEFLLATMSHHAATEGPPRTLGQKLRDLTPGAWVGRMTGADS